MLTQRHSTILKLVVESHIAHGGAVGSQAVREQARLNLSSATIRNAMSELEVMGYLTQPHTSAGRIPTDRGFRFYVDALLERDPLGNGTKCRILEACEKGGMDLPATLHQISREVADLTHQACLVLPPDMKNAILERIHFIRLEGRQGVRGSKIVALLVSHSGQLQNRILTLEESYTQKELDAIGRSLSRRLKGLTLKEARQQLAEEVASGEQDYRDLQKKLLEGAVGPWSEGAGLIVNGHLNLLSPDDLTGSGRLLDVLAEIEEKKKYIDLLDHCLRANGVQLFIGSESELSREGGCAMVACKFTGPENLLSGTLGVLGPTRLDYSYVIPLVEFTVLALSGLLSSGVTPAEMVERPES
ncbi:MAG: heat-inducible transcription repressor HrcA [Magnetococcales bacterium]|nr:heat-inducible transcription repressor HrcA [Magnetococcales bacterium]